jgi:hydroxypyruvate reductase
VTLAEKRRRVRALVRAGAPIGEVNRLRTKLSAVKGGGLGAATRARLVTLVLSDVPGDRARLVGSGPTIRRARRVAPENGARGDVVSVVGTNPDGVIVPRAARAEASRSDPREKPAGRGGPRGAPLVAVRSAEGPDRR